MSNAKACAIFKNIDSEIYTDRDKALAIHIVMSMATHNSITKDNMLKVIKWLFDRQWKVAEEV